MWQSLEALIRAQLKIYIIKDGKNIMGETSERIKAAAQDNTAKRTRNIGKDDNGVFIFDGAPSFSSIDFSTLEGKKQLFNMKNGQTQNLSVTAKNPAHSVAVKEIVIFPGHVEGRNADGSTKTDASTGEVLTDAAEKAYVVTPDGTIYHTHSVGLVNGIRNMISDFGAPTYDPAIEIQVYETDTRDGKNKIFKFSIV